MYTWQETTVNHNFLRGVCTKALYRQHATCRRLHNGTACISSLHANTVDVCIQAVCMKTPSLWLQIIRNKSIWPQGLSLCIKIYMYIYSKCVYVGSKTSPLHMHWSCIPIARYTGTKTYIWSSGDFLLCFPPWKCLSCRKFVIFEAVIDKVHVLWFTHMFYHHPASKNAFSYINLLKGITSPWCKVKCLVEPWD